MQAGFLSETWLDGFDLTVGTAGTSPAAGSDGGPAADMGPGRTVHVRRVVTGGPDGDVTLEATVAGPGPGAAEAELTLTTTHEVATALDAGEMPVAVAYMQGRLKAEGDMPTLYALLAALTAVK